MADTKEKERGKTQPEKEQARQDAATQQAPISAQAAVEQVPAKIEGVTADGEVVMITPLKKMTLKEMGVDGAKLIKDLDYGEAQVVARMYGVAWSYKEGESKFKDPTGAPRMDYKFTGDFEGVNLLTGEIFKAKTAYLPSPVDELLAAALSSEGDGGVNFGAETSVVKIKKQDGTDGYKFRSAMPTNPRTSDPVKEMRERMKSFPTRKPVATIEGPGV